MRRPTSLRTFARGFGLGLCLLAASAADAEPRSGEISGDLKIRIEGLEPIETELFFTLVLDGRRWAAQHNRDTPFAQGRVVPLDRRGRRLELRPDRESRIEFLASLREILEKEFDALVDIDDARFRYRAKTSKDGSETTVVLKVSFKAETDRGEHRVVFKARGRGRLTP